ncbi:MAG TPA: YciI family protein [Steroidobacteraceae bacterium]|jgi:hypothetical protein|nr:YciI family protein [Steroidobacteraceae bacterium]
MKVMVIVKASQASERGEIPSEELLTEMGKFNEELVKTGVMLAGEGLLSSARGVRVQFDGSSARTVAGPFANTTDLVAGFWLWQVRSLEEAVEWIRRSPFRKTGGEIEIRQVAGPDDFGDNLTPELKAREEKLREQLGSH